MIIVKLMGGLGNQMFQYACGRRLSNLYNGPLLLDTHFLDNKDTKQNFTSRDYELDIFKLNAKIAEDSVLVKYYSTSFISRVQRKIKYHRIILEEGRKFNDLVLKAPSAVYLDGYWQSEKYFKDISNVIRYEFTFPKKSENDYVSELCKSIKNANSVSVHIRRGDYCTNKKTNMVHGLLDLEYYSRAIDYINKKFGNVVFYVFSDDPEWVKNNFFNNSQTIMVYHQYPVKNYIDMKLMSYCRHNIIANSSYSWWAAWLNNNPDKVVIAPQKWYAFDNNDEIIDYRIPSSWLTI